MFDFILFQKLFHFLRVRNTKVLNYEIIYDVIGYDVTSNIPRVNKVVVKSFYPDFGYYHGAHHF